MPGSRLTPASHIAGILIDSPEGRFSFTVVGEGSALTFPQTTRAGIDDVHAIKRPTKAILVPGSLKLSGILTNQDMQRLNVVDATLTVIFASGRRVTVLDATNITPDAIQETVDTGVTEEIEFTFSQVTDKSPAQ